MLLILGAAALWSLMGPASRVALMEGGMAPGELAFWRAVIGSGLFLAQAAAGRKLRISARGFGLAALFGVVAAAMFSVYAAAIRSVGAALASALVYTAAGWVALGGWVLFGARPGRRGWASVGLAVGGAVVIGLSVEGVGGLTVTLGGLLLGALTGVLYAAQTLLGQRIDLPLSTLFAYAMPVAALCLLPQATGTAFAWPVWGGAAVVAVCATWAAPFLYFAGLRRMDAARGAALVTVEPVLTALLAWLTWGEVLPAAGYLGCGLIVLGALLAAARSSSAAA